MARFERLFDSGDADRDNFRSRYFGLFSERIVHDWSKNPKSRYRDLSRPTLWAGGEHATLDFTLQGPDGRRFVTEQKAELAFEGHKYLRLTTASQIEHHEHGRAFRWFVDVARDPTSHEVRVQGKPIMIDGAILIWGAVDPGGRTEAMDRYGFTDVLALEDMLRDLLDWQDATWLARVSELRAWTNGLLDEIG